MTGPFRVTGWSTALRIARREARRSWGRSLLVIALIGLPVLGLTTAAVSLDTFQLSPVEQAERRLGTADAAIAAVSTEPVTQAPTDLYPLGPTSATPPATTDPAAFLPVNRAIPDNRGIVTIRTVGGRAGVQARELDYEDPLARGILVPLAGRAPRTTDEVALTPYAARRAGVTIGGTISYADGSRSFRVVGLVENPDELRQQLVVFKPGVLAAAADEPANGERSWLVDTPAKLDWAAVRQLNQRGVVALSRTVLLDPPDFNPYGAAGSTRDTLALGAIAAGLALLEVILLAGPAFAVGARRRRRDLALVAAAGGTPAHLRRIVVADGIVLGFAAAAVGIVLGIAAAAASQPLIEEYVAQQRPGSFRVFPLALAAAALVAVGAGVLAALVPAWLASRVSVVAALTGRSGANRPRRRWAVAGVLMIVAGAATAAWGAKTIRDTVILAGLVIAELGVVLCTPALIAAIAPLGRLLPVAPRIALRDLGRNRAAAAPAISAVLAAVAGSMITGVMLASQAEGDRLGYVQTRPLGAITATYTRGEEQPGPDQAARASVEAAVRSSVPVERLAWVGRSTCPPGVSGRCVAVPVMPDPLVCPYYKLNRPLTPSEQKAARRDDRCNRTGTFFSEAYLSGAVIDPADLDTLAVLDAPTRARAEAVLRDGGVLVSDSRFIVDGLVTYSVANFIVETDGRGVGIRPSAPQTRTVALPGMALPGGANAPEAILSPASVARLGLRSELYALSATTLRMPTEAERDKLRDVLADGAWTTNVETGYSSRANFQTLILALVAALVTLGAAAIATGLAAADGRADLATLGAVGASPGVRRLLTLSQTGLIAGLGGLLGAVAGIAGAAAIIAGTNQGYADQWPAPPDIPLTVPWPAVLLAVVVAPAVAMLGAGLLTRARLPVERRI